MKTTVWAYSRFVLGTILFSLSSGCSLISTSVIDGIFGALGQSEEHTLAELNQSTKTGRFDLAFIIDNSASMNNDQEALASNMYKLADSILQNIDICVMRFTTDAYSKDIYARSEGGNGGKICRDPNDANAMSGAEFVSRMEDMLTVCNDDGTSGCEGSSWERHSHSTFQWFLRSLGFDGFKNIYAPEQAYDPSFQFREETPLLHFSLTDEPGQLPGTGGASYQDFNGQTVNIPQNWFEPENVYEMSLNYLKAKNPNLDDADSLLYFVLVYAYSQEEPPYRTDQTGHYPLEHYYTRLFDRIPAGHAIRHDTDSADYSTIMDDLINTVNNNVDLNYVIKTEHPAVRDSISLSILDTNNNLVTQILSSQFTVEYLETESIIYLDASYIDDFNFQGDYVLRVEYIPENLL